MTQTVIASDQPVCLKPERQQPPGRSPASNGSPAEALEPEHPRLQPLGASGHDDELQELQDLGRRRLLKVGSLEAGTALF